VGLKIGSLDCTATIEMRRVQSKAMARLLRLVDIERDAGFFEIVARHVLLRWFIHETFS
jgi:hypothetical protein